MFLSLLIFLVGLEFTVYRLQKFVIRHGYNEIYEKLKKELMILGIISFTVFVYEQASSSVVTEYLLAFEMAHIIILFMALSFIVQALILIQYANMEGKRLVVAVRTTSDELIRSYNNLGQAESLVAKFEKFAFSHFSACLPLYPEFRHHIEYKLIERFFLRRHELPREFKFSKYVHYLFKVSWFEPDIFSVKLVMLIMVTSLVLRIIFQNLATFHHWAGFSWPVLWLSISSESL